jgi:CheY-like chemotaxis protein
MSEKPRVLIVDDTPENIDVLVGVLGSDYELTAATNGPDALNIVEKSRPDIILLDVMMPGMSGYDVCRQLKSAPETKDILIIFITALGADANEQQGLELGAVDYISKPFNPSLVQTRIANHLSLEKARRELREYGEKLEGLVQQRTKELAEAHQQLKAIDETKSQFLSAISHELRTPANGILGIGSLAIDALPPGEEKDDFQQDFDQSCMRLTEMLDSAMHLAELQSGDKLLKLENIQLLSAVEEAVNKIAQTCPQSVITLSGKEILDCRIKADRAFLVQSLETLFLATAKLNEAGEPLPIIGKAEKNSIIIQVLAKGALVPDELLKTIFEPFSLERSASYLEELGLRLPVAEKMIRAMFGKIVIEKTEDSGLVIQISLPSA